MYLFSHIQLIDRVYPFFKLDIKIRLFILCLLLFEYHGRFCHVVKSFLSHFMLKDLCLSNIHVSLTFWKIYFFQKYVNLIWWGLHVCNNNSLIPCKGVISWQRKQVYKKRRSKLLMDSLLILYTNGIWMFMKFKERKPPIFFYSLLRKNLWYSSK